MKQRKIKWFLIVESIVFYFSLLNLISHARGPAQYEVQWDTPLVQMESFQPFFDMGVSITENCLPIVNPNDGTAAGYQCEMSLQDVGAIYVQFKIDCPAEQAGSMLIVDLYNGEAGYDSPEQEQQVILQAGINDFQVELIPGEHAPTQGFLRIFTTNQVEYQISNLEVYNGVALPKVTLPMQWATVISGVLLAGTAAYVLQVMKHGEI